MKSIGVVGGGGTMGTGIVYAFAMAGYPVYVVEADSLRREGLLESLQKIADVGIRKNKISAESKLTLSDNVNLLDSIDQLPEALGLVIETVPENMTLKKQILSRIEARSPEYIATNTSVLSIDLLGEAVNNRDRFLGMHFFNPVWAIHLVELIRGKDTSDQTVEEIKNYVQGLGKESLVVRNVPGFATSRLDLIASLEAMRMYESGVASIEDIDKAAVLAYHHPIGPLRLSDIVGLDVRLDIARALEGYHGARFSPPQILIDMVENNKLGKKTGEGFYSWD